MGLTLLDQFGELVRRNETSFRLYVRELSGVPGIRLAEYKVGEKSNYQFIVLEIDAVTTGIRRDSLMRLLWAEDVMARRYFYPGCHRMEPYATLQPEAGRDLPATEALLERVLCLPGGAVPSEARIARICKVVKFALAHGAEIQSRLDARDINPE